jgi:hypothetical protein
VLCNSINHRHCHCFVIIVPYNVTIGIATALEPLCSAITIGIAIALQLLCPTTTIGNVNGAVQAIGTLLHHTPSANHILMLLTTTNHRDEERNVAIRAYMQMVPPDNAAPTEVLAVSSIPNHTPARQPVHLWCIRCLVGDANFEIFSRCAANHKAALVVGAP